MKIQEKYLEALKTFNDFVTISEWAIKFAEMNPDQLENAEGYALGHSINTTGIKEIAAKISSIVSRGKFNESISIDSSERPKKVKYSTQEELDENTQNEINKDIEPLTRKDIIDNAKDKMEVSELYRIKEFESIQENFKEFFGVVFEIDHAQALFNKKQGEHHPDNLQLLLRLHNGKKSNKSWVRFTFDEQVNYIRATISLQEIVADKFDIKIDRKALKSLLLRLKEVY